VNSPFFVLFVPFCGYFLSFAWISFALIRGLSRRRPCERRMHSRLFISDKPAIAPAHELAELSG